MFVHYFIDISHMQDKRTNLTTAMLKICFLFALPWRTFAYGTFIILCDLLRKLNTAVGDITGKRYAELS